MGVKIWPDLEKLSCGATHALVVVAESLETLKTCLRSEPYKEWQSLISPLAKDKFVIHAPLGVDLTPLEEVGGKPKEDPTLVVCCFNFNQKITEDSDEYAGMLAAVSSINRLPGAAGKIAASLHPTGFAMLPHSYVQASLQLQEDKSLGCTHCFLAVVDSPESFKLLIQSKTFSKWKSTSEPHF